MRNSVYFNMLLHMRAKKEIMSSQIIIHTERKKKITRKTRIVSPFGLYAVLSAISYKLCVRYCDIISLFLRFFLLSFSFSFFYFVFLFLSCVRVDSHRKREIHIQIVEFERGNFYEISFDIHIYINRYMLYEKEAIMRNVRNNQPPSPAFNL